MADDITVGSVGVKIVPDASGWDRSAEQQMAPGAQAVGEQIGRMVGQQVQRQIQDALRDGVKNAPTDAPARTQGAKAGRTFGDSLKASLKAALADMPKVKIDADSSSADLALSNLQLRMEALSNKKIGVDIDANAAKAELDSIKAELTELGQNSPDIAVQVDTARAAADLDRFSAQVDRVAQANATVRVQAETEQASLALGEVEDEADAVAHKSPTITVNINGDEAEARLAEIAAASRTLGVESPKITINVDPDEAEAQLAAIAAQCAALGIETPHIRIDVDSAGAEAHLAAISAQVAALGLEDVDIRVDSDGLDQAGTAAEGAAAGVSGLMAAGIALAPVFVAVGAAAVGALAAVGGAIAAVTAGIGVAILALKPIFDAYQALNAAKTSGSGSVSSNANAIAAANAQVASSERSLANTRQNVADQAVQAAQKVKDAQQNLLDVERSTAEQIKNAEQGVTQARDQASQQQQADIQAVTTAKQQAAQANQQANQQVVAAEQSLASAQQQALQAQQNLNAARQQAVKNLQQMAFSAADAALSKRQDELNLQQAQANLASVNANPRATQLQREQAQLAYDQAKQALLEQTQAAKDAADANAKAQKAGVDGDKGVVAAKKAVEQANANILAQQKALVDAQKNLVQTQVQGAQAITAAQDKLAKDQIQSAQAVARAEQSLADARYNGARSVQKAHEGVAQAQQAQSQQARQGAFQVTQATAAVTNAQRTLAQAYQTTGGQASSSSKKAAAALAALTPAGRDFLSYIMSAKAGFGELSKTAQNGFLPGLEKGLKALSPLMKPIQGLVAGLSKAMGSIAEEAGKALAGPDGQKFVAFLSKNLPTWLKLTASMAGGFIQGIAALFEGFGPIITDFLSGMAKGLQNFGKWADQVTKSDGFKSFLAYIAKEGPVVADFFGHLFVIIGKLAVGLAPLGALMMNVLDWLSKLLAKMSPNTLLLIAAAFGVLWVAMTGGIAGVILAIVAISAWLVNLYQKNETFRDIVNKVWDAVKAAWKGIQVAIGAVVDWFTKTAAPKIGSFFSGVKAAAVAVYNWFTGPFAGFFTKTLPGVFQGAIDWVKAHWVLIASIITGPIGAATIYISRHWSQIEGYFTDAYNWVVGWGKRSWAGLQEIFTHPVQAAKNVINNILGALGLQKTFRDAVDAIGRIWSGIEKKFSGPLNFVKGIINDFIGAFNKVGKLVGFTIPKLATGGSVSVGTGGGHKAPLPGYAGGGPIYGPWRGPRADNVLGVSDSGVPVARVNPNEFVHPVDAVQHYGLAAMEAVRTKRATILPGFADGGLAPIVKTVAYALAQVGKPYVWGAAGPDAFDCSGLTSAAWEHGAGVHLTHLAAAQHREGFGPISRSNLFPGDLVFPTVTPGGGIPHVEMYVGDGNVVEAMNPSLGIRGPHPMNGFAGGARRPALFATADASNTSSVMSALGSALAAAAKKGGSLLGGLGGAIFDPIKNWIGDHLGGLKKFAGPFAGKFLPGMAKHLASSALSTGVHKAESFFDFGGGGSTNVTGTGVQRWAETIANALSMNGLPTSDAYVNAWLRQVQTESSGNPLAVQNGYIDVNTLHGDLAKGLLQVISSTFAAYRFPGHDNIFNPLDNALAAINYAKHVYGPSMLSVIGHGHGYEDGTLSALPGIAEVAENGAELVLGRQWRNFQGGEQVANAQQTANLLSGDRHYNVHIHAEELRSVRTLEDFLAKIELSSQMEQGVRA